MYRWAFVIGLVLTASNANAQLDRVLGNMGAVDSADFTISFQANITSLVDEAQSISGVCGVFTGFAQADAFDFASAVDGYLGAASFSGVGAHVGLAPIRMSVDPTTHSIGQRVTVAIDAAHPEQAHWWRCAITSVECRAVDANTTGLELGRFRRISAEASAPNGCPAYKSDPTPNLVIEGSIQ